MLKERLRILTDLDGVSSQEDQVIEYMFREFRQFTSKVEVDTIGNVVAKIECGKPKAKKIMLFGHMDEIGLILRRVNPNGFLRIERIGGVSTQILPGMRVKIHGRKGVVKGIIGTPSHHFIKQESKFSVPQVSDLYVDIGAYSAQEVESRGVRVGDFITFENNFHELGEHVLSAKAMDDRVALAVLLEVIEKLKNQNLEWDVYFVAAVMEEFNIRGILPAVRKVKPDVMIGIDITPACDTPDMDYNTVCLGGGPTITYMNFHGRGTLAGVLPDRKLLRFMENVCQQKNLTYQPEIAPGVITENAFALFENEGIAVANLSIPTRYTHSPFECIDLRDVEGLVQILIDLILELKQDQTFGKAKGE